MGAPRPARPHRLHEARGAHAAESPPRGARLRARPAARAAARDPRGNAHFLWKSLGKRYKPLVARTEFPPGPRLPQLVQAAIVTADPYGWMRRRRARYGDVFSSHFPFFGRIVYVVDPADIKRVFAGDPSGFHAGEANATVLGDALGEHSLLTLDGERHMSQRKLLLPPFHGQSVKRYAEVMADAAETEVATWPLNKPFALRPRM